MSRLCVTCASEDGSNSWWAEGLFVLGLLVAVCICIFPEETIQRVTGWVFDGDRLETANNHITMM